VLAFKDISVLSELEKIGGVKAKINNQILDLFEN